MRKARDAARMCTKSLTVGLTHDPRPTLARLVLDKAPGHALAASPIPYVNGHRRAVVIFFKKFKRSFECFHVQEIN